MWITSQQSSRPAIGYSALLCLLIGLIPDNHPTDCRLGCRFYFGERRCSSTCTSRETPHLSCRCESSLKFLSSLLSHSANLAMSCFEQLFNDDCHHIRLKYTTNSPFEAYLGASTTALHDSIWGLRNDHRQQQKFHKVPITDGLRHTSLCSIYW